MDCFFPRRRKSAAERRAQRQRSEARLLQHALTSLNDVQAHRGGSLTRFGHAMRSALISLGPHCDDVPATDFLDGAVPFYKVRFPMGHPRCGDPTQLVEQVAPDLVSLSSPRGEGEDVAQQSFCRGDSACFSVLRTAESDVAACEAECQRLIDETRSKIALLQQAQDKLSELRAQAEARAQETLISDKAVFVGASGAATRVVGGAVGAACVVDDDDNDDVSDNYRANSRFVQAEAHAHEQNYRSAVMRPGDDSDEVYGCHPSLPMDHYGFQPAEVGDPSVHMGNPISMPAAGWGPLFPIAERLGPRFDLTPQPGEQECKHQ